MTSGSPATRGHSDSPFGVGLAGFTAVIVSSGLAAAPGGRLTLNSQLLPQWDTISYISTTDGIFLGAKAGAIAFLIRDRDEGQRRRAAPSASPRAKEKRAGYTADEAATEAHRHQRRMRSDRVR
jgi:hypothetical protein